MVTTHHRSMEWHFCSSLEHTVQFKLDSAQQWMVWYSTSGPEGQVSSVRPVHGPDQVPHTRTGPHVVLAGPRVPGLGHRTLHHPRPLLFARAAHLLHLVLCMGLGSCTTLHNWSSAQGMAGRALAHRAFHRCVACPVCWMTKCQWLDVARESGLEYPCTRQTEAGSCNLPQCGIVKFAFKVGLYMRCSTQNA